ncbi:MAG: glycosidase [Gammaproteobacteria bacterium]|nr:glycosidase [Gammaproteobacteria bacterium]
MSNEVGSKTDNLPSGVMLNAYPDSIGKALVDTVRMLKRAEFKDVFSLFYILPTFFNSDLDRGFSVIDYDINRGLVSANDLKDLDKLNVLLKFDLVLNHLSVGSPQFQDMLKRGDESQYKDFFIDWNEFWASYGEMGEDGHVIPDERYLQQLFMRKPGLPILKVRFPDGSDRPYWNTFYQEVLYREIAPEDLSDIAEVTPDQAQSIALLVNQAIRTKADFKQVDLGVNARFKDAVIAVIENKRNYLGQMDLNAQSEAVWSFYDETLKKLSDYGAKLVRLDAFAYLHKKPGMTNFFNKPGTWEYLERLRMIAEKYDLILLPEIHAEYGYGLHEEVAGKGFPIYDFFLPGLVIDALDRGTALPLRRWISELYEKGIKTINMLGCHDGIPVLDLRGKEVPGISKAGLLTDTQIDAVIERILERGGRVKNLYGPDGKKIAYYQVNATFFSALGEDENKLLLARAIQMFMPGIPQVWYLDLFAGTNNYAAADSAGTAGHKEINRTTLANSDIEQGLKRPVVRDQIDLIRLRNTSPAFNGELEIGDSAQHLLQLTWKKGPNRATLKANLRNHSFTIEYQDAGSQRNSLAYG